MKRLLSVLMCACLLCAALPALSLGEELPVEAPETPVEEFAPELAEEPAEPTLEEPAPEATPEEAPEPDAPREAPEAPEPEAEAEVPDEGLPVTDTPEVPASPEEPEEPAAPETSPAEEVPEDGDAPEETPGEEAPEAEAVPEGTPEEEIVEEEPIEEGEAPEAAELLLEEAALATDDCLEIVNNRVIKYTGGASKVVIPEGVTCIAHSVFSNCDELTDISLPSTLTTIESRAFYRCTSLASVTIPGSVSWIGDFAFTYCEALSTVIIQDGVTTLGESMFFGCGSLASVSLPNSLKTIGAQAFRECTSLTKVTLPSGLTSIRGGAFYKSALTSVSLPSGLQEFGAAAFSYTNLKTVVIPEGITELDRTFRYCERLTSCTLPSSLKTLNGTFDNCVNLSSINLPEGLLTIGRETFAHCHHLVEIDLPDSVTTIGDLAFHYCKRLRSLELPVSLSDLGTNVLRECTALTSLTVASGSRHFKASNDVIYCKDDASLCLCAPYVSRIVVPSGIKVIREMAFRCSPALASITLPEGLEQIEHAALSYCGALTYIRLPSSVKAIDTAAFECSGGGNLVVDAYCAPTFIGGYAFNKCGVTINLYADSDVFRQYAARGGYRLIDYTGSLIYSASCSRDTVPAGSQVVFSVVTGNTASSVTMYAENGSAVKTWRDSDVTRVSNDTRTTWKIPYTFNVKGNRTVTFRSISADPGISVGVKVLTKEPNVTSVSAVSENSIVRVKTPVQFTVTTPDTASFLALFTETGKKVKVWSRTGNSTVSGGVRTWKIKYSFANTGHRRISFRASRNGNYGDGKVIALLVATPGPVVRAVSGPAQVEGSEAAVFTVTTTSDAKYLALFAENGAKARVWSASAHSSLSGQSRVWTISYSFAVAGERTVEFRASAGGEYGFGEKASVTVNKVYSNVLYARATPTSALSEEAITFTVATDSLAKKLVMYTILSTTVNGRSEYKTVLVKTYSASQYAVRSGDQLNWTFTYRIRDAGNRILQFAADAGYGTESGERRNLSLTIY